MQLVHGIVRCELLLPPPRLHVLNQVKKFQYEIDYHNGMLGNLFMKGISNEMNNNTTNNNNQKRLTQSEEEKNERRKKAKSSETQEDIALEKPLARGERNLFSIFDGR